VALEHNCVSKFFRRRPDPVLDAKTRLIQVLVASWRFLMGRHTRAPFSGKSFDFVHIVHVVWIEEAGRRSDPQFRQNESLVGQYQLAQVTV